MPTTKTIFSACTVSLGSGARSWLVLLVLLLLPWRVGVGAELTVENPHRVKAAFLRNFAHYVTWPPNAFDNDTSPWRIGVLGDAPFSAVAANMLRGRTEQGRSFEVYSADSLHKLPLCQIIYVAFKDPERRRITLAALKDKPVLTIGDEPDMLQAGAIIRLQLDERVRMSVNLDQARAVALNIQTNMLEVSSEVLENGAIRKMR